MNSNNKENKHMFSSDRAIKDESEDLLNRSRFVEELSKSLLSWKENESLIVGIYGKWGNGKTSVKNILKEKIEKNKHLQVDFFEFNPWQWSSSQGYLHSYLLELSVLLGREQSGTEISKKILTYSKYLSFTNEKFDEVRNNIEKILRSSSLIVGVIAIKLPGDFSIYAIALAVVLSILSIPLSFLSWLAKTYIEFNDIEKKENKNLEEQKSEIKELLSQHNKTILVVIDDIDRLSPSEIKDLFKLIKANADFPKIVYLTLFQRDLVEGVLSQNGVYNGSEYLEKIIQVGINLPEIPAIGIHSILFKKLDSLIDEHGVVEKFSQDRWSELYSEGVKHYFHNLRDVNRFISSLSFQLGSLSNQKILEVNIVDLIGVEVLRQFEFSTYKILFKNKEIFTHMAGSSSSGSENHVHKSKILKIIEDSGDSSESVKSILKVLFPNIQWAWSNYHSRVDNDDFVSLRICHPARFDRYFSFFMTKEDFSEYEIQSILESTNSKDEMIEKLKKFHQEGRLEAFLGKFEAYKQKVPAGHYRSFLGAMLEMGDLISDERKGFFEFSPLVDLNRIILWYLKKKDFVENRREVFLEGIKNSSGIFLPIKELADEYERSQFDKYPDQFSMNEDDKNFCKKLILEIIDKNKNKNEFLKNKHLARIVLIWLNMDTKGAKEWLQKYLSNDNNFLKFIYDLISISYSSSGYSGKTHYKLRVGVLGKYFDDVPATIARINSLENKDFNEAMVKDNLKAAVKWANNELKDPKKYNDIYDESDDED